jgi:hypothetical protein
MTLSPDEIDILERVSSKKELQTIFFRKLKGLKWFDDLERRGFFNPNQNPAPIPAKQEGYINIPAWPVTDYLVVTSPELKKENNEAYARKFLELLRACTEYAIDNKYSNYRTWWQFSKIIKDIPSHLITLEDTNIVNYWLNDPYERSLVADEIGEQWLPLLLNINDEHSHLIALKIIDLLFTIEFVQLEEGSTRKEVRLLIKEYYLQKIAAKIINIAGKVLKQKVVDIFKVRFEGILNEVKNDAWSYIWRAAIENHAQNHRNDDPEDVILEAFRDSLLSWIAIEPDIAKVYVENLLDSEFQTLKRIAIYATEVKFNELSGLVDKVILEKNFSSNQRHELWRLLNKHFNNFTTDQQRTVLHIINNTQVLDENNKVIERSTAYQKAIWLSALKDNTPEISLSYAALINKAGSEPEHPDFSSYMSAVGRVGHKSSLSREIILSLEIDELVKQLNAFEAKGGFDDPDIEDLAKEFEDSVKSLPLNFHTHLSKFTNSKPPYIHSLISAYKELWTEKTQLPWDDVWANLLDFCKSVVETPSFWVDEKNQNERNFYANWVVSEIGRLIEAGTKSDDHAFNESMLDLAKEILSIILNHQKGEHFEESSDAVSIAINSPRGQCIEALINLTLRSCRLKDKLTSSHKDVWEKFKPIFDTELKKTSRGEYEFSTLVTQYLPNFLYMSNDWVMSNLNNIFNYSDYLGWLCAMQGYACNNTVYEQVYKSLANDNHLLKVLDDENIRERLREVIVQQIVVAYLNDYESLEQPSSLIAQVLTRKNTSEISQLIWFLWIQRKDSDIKLTTKIFELWPRLIRIIDVTTNEGKKLASKLCMWVVFIDEITPQNRSLLLDIAPYANEDHNSYVLMENIAKVSEKQPDEAFQIWMRILERDTPDFPPEAIKTSLLNIYNSGNDGIRNATTIASKYIATGNEQPNQWLNDHKSEL